MTAITTHVLDLVRGVPARGVGVVLERRGDDGTWAAAGRGETDGDGRLRDWIAQETPLEPGVYRLVFDTGRYFGEQAIAAFYPQVVIIFQTGAEAPHYHVPLLLAPYGYSTYRGS